MDSHRVIPAILGEIVLGQLLSYFISRYPDYGVLAGIEVEGKLEELHAERALFECAAGTADGVIDDILEELTASLARAKRGALQQAAEFRPHGLLL